jgi:galactonate dehydratase
VKITAIDTYIAGNPWKNWLFARVSTDEGIHGVGEGTLNYFGRTVEAAIHELSPLILGMDPFQVEMISQKLIRDDSYVRRFSDRDRVVGHHRQGDQSADL